ncbi:hypothetical protein OUZ56_020146 [Daphnia magna]|uniref:Uncharacterized protein n=1 Tax=Daphnia magna TaxID=35525 RepID=A0ABQ9ZDN5_9CRUS|nr:hypothetical protein OUZ56_014226 [Daphnia magna]KAK4011026.1 hypothetical protein OUZ56_020146 [Daphnia magna]
MEALHPSRELGPASNLSTARRSSVDIPAPWYSVPNDSVSQNRRSCSTNSAVMCTSGEAKARWQRASVVDPDPNTPRIVHPSLVLIAAGSSSAPSR